MGWPGSAGWSEPTAKALSVYAQMQTGLIHGARTRCEENSLCIVEFEGGVVGCAENSWAKLGGMEDRIEVCGTGGVVYADLFMGNSALTYSDKGYGYAMEKAGFDARLDVHELRGGLQSGLPARAEALHLVRARRLAAAHDRRGRPRGARVDERRVPVGPNRTESAAAVSTEGCQADRPLARIGDMNVLRFDSESAWIQAICVDVARSSPDQAGFEDVPAVGQDAREHLRGDVTKCAGRARLVRARERVRAR